MLSSRSRRSAAGWIAGGVAAGGMLLAGYTVQAQTASAAGAGTVSLSPASGATSGKPTWSTSSACPAGFQGSAIFRAIKADGTTFSISPATNHVTAPFSGTLQAPLSVIQSVAGIRNGGTEKLVILCFSGPSLTGTSQQEMSMFITYSASGSSYTSGASAPASPGPASSAPASSSSPGSSSPASSSSPGSSSAAATAAARPSASTGPATPASPAPSPTPVNSDLPVTG